MHLRRRGTGISRRVLARGKDTITLEDGAGRVTLKLSDRGRRELRAAPRRGLRVRTLVRVAERYTGRRGREAGRLRIRLR